LNYVDKKLTSRIVFLCALIIGGTFGLLTLCHPPIALIGDICVNLPDFEIFVGVVIGTVTTALFFFYIERGQEKLKNEFQDFLQLHTKAYVVRTVMLNLKDVFTGEKFDRDDMEPLDDTRKKFLKALDEKYIQKFEIKDDDEIKIVYNIAKSHDPWEGHHPKWNKDNGKTTCPYCDKHFLIGKINKVIENLKNPLL